MRKSMAAIAASCLLAAPALAEQHLYFEPLAQDGATIRMEDGVPTVDVRREHGAVQVTPLGLDHGRLTFGVSVINMGEAPDNFGVEDIHANIAGHDVPVLTRARLDQMARNRATWSQIGVALLAGAGAIAASNIDDGHHHHGYGHSYYGGHGGYGWGDHSDEVVLAGASLAAGAVGIGSIQSRLDATRAAIGDEIVQTTTVDPGDSYGGRIVIDRPHGRTPAWPQEVRLHMIVNGEDFPFVFRVTRAQ
jgi:hypothetical protein